MKERKGRRKSAREEKEERMNGRRGEREGCKCIN